LLRFSSAGDEDQATGWSPSALRLIELAPEPAKVLDTLLGRFAPHCYSCSRADILASRMPLIDTLKQHSRPAAAVWAEQHAPEYAAIIERQRVQETTEDRARNQTFELSDGV
jgi:hypothetical protein